MSIKTITFAAVAGICSLSPIIASAQAVTFTPLDKLTDTSPITAYIINLYNFGLATGGILAVGMIVAGAIYYSVSGAIDKKAEGKDMILSAIFGLALLFGSYLVLNTINPELVTLSNPGPATGLATPFTCTVNTLQSDFVGNNKHPCSVTEVPGPVLTGTPPVLKCNCYVSTSTSPTTLCPSTQCQAYYPPLTGGTYTITPPYCPQDDTCENTSPITPGETIQGVSEYWKSRYYPQGIGPSAGQCIVLAYKNPNDTRLFYTSRYGLNTCVNSN